MRVSEMPTVTEIVVSSIRRGKKIIKKNYLRDTTQLLQHRPPFLLFHILSTKVSLAENVIYCRFSRYYSYTPPALPTCSPHYARLPPFPPLRCGATLLEFPFTQTAGSHPLDAVGYHYSTPSGNLVYTIIIVIYPPPLDALHLDLLRLRVKTTGQRPRRISLSQSKQRGHTNQRGSYCCCIFADRAREGESPHRDFRREGQEGFPPTQSLCNGRTW